MLRARVEELALEVEKRKAELAAAETDLKSWAEKYRAVSAADPARTTPRMPARMIPGWVGREAGDVKEIVYKGVPIRFRWCPPGSFRMGSPPEEEGRDDDEDQVDVRLTVGFWMMETEVTQALWKAVMGNDAVAGRWTESSGVGDDLPVYEVSHAEATEFAGILSDELRGTGLLSGELELGLPTEAQWEYAARAGTASRFHWGDEASRLGDHAWFAANDGGKRQPVGTKLPNDWGIRDTAGSVSEWTASPYSQTLRGGDDPSSFSSTSGFVERGGGSVRDPRQCRPADRNWFAPTFRFGGLGLRLVANRDATPISPAWLGGNPGDVNEVLFDGVPIRLRWCPPGSYRMGSPPEEAGRDEDEEQVEVRIQKGFWLMENEVSQKLWKKVNQFDGVAARWEARFGIDDDLPCYSVNHNEAIAFCSKLNDALLDSGQLPEEYEFVLPTEAQWEYAARAGSTTRFHWGDDESRLGEHAWFSGNDGGKHHALGSKRPNDWGLFDTAGSVWEWTSSWYEIKLSSITNGRPQQDHGDFVTRGGGMGYAPWLCRPASRAWAEPDVHYPGLGFRLAVVHSVRRSLKQTMTASLREPLEERASETIAKASNRSIPPLGWVGREAGDVKEIVYKGVPIRFRWCPPGSFRMGSPPNEKDRYDNEDQVDVRLTAGFWMMETEVTQGLWKAVMGNDAVAGRWSSDYGVGDDLPVYEVSHTEATAFAVQLTSALRGAGLLSGELELALPTEAQWEYAARAGSTSRFHWGDDESKLGDHAWFSGNAGGWFWSSYLHPVGSKRPNDWGLRDTAGSVWEWTSSGYADKMTGGDDPRGAQGAANFVNRGGGVWLDPWNCRPARRGWGGPGYRRGGLGFRLAAVRSGP
ncbi:MAG: formylglycine-generating enzyme family protein [Isosphaeraceae bacterium]|nr:formylglycine-generating enzyme family protein [Isosphaeraceae bacterium]